MCALAIDRISGERKEGGNVSLNTSIRNLFHKNAPLAHYFLKHVSHYELKKPKISFQSKMG